MSDYIIFVADTKIIENGIVPLSFVIFTVITIIVVTSIFVKNEIKGVKKNEKN